MCHAWKLVGLYFQILPPYTVGLCFQRGRHSSEMAELGWPESRALPTSPGVGEPLSAEGQMVDILGFVGQTVSVARTELSCHSEKTSPRQHVTEYVRLGSNILFSNEVAGRIYPVNHSHRHYHLFSIVLPLVF